ncbi:MAG: response regulator [Acidobacteria bacterium]|nr:response regulator [Acidobacteriota bacterium]
MIGRGLPKTRLGKAALLSCLLAPLPSSTPGRVVRIGTDNTPPYHYLESNGRPRGMVADILQEAARRRGIQLRWELRSEGPVRALSAKAVDLWPLLSTQSTMWPEFHFTRPYMRNSYVLLFRKEEYESPEGLKRAKRISVIGYPLASKIAARAAPEAELSRQRKREDALEAVCRDQSDVALLEARTAQYLMLHRPEACAGQDFHTVGLGMAPTELAVASTREASKYADELRAEIDDMMADGVVGRLMAPWNYYYSGEVEALYKEEEAHRARQISMALAAVLGLAALGLLRVAWRMQEARQQAQGANVAKTQFLAVMSHEIRTPLHGLLGISALLKDSKLDAEQREFVELIEQSGKSLLELVNDILDLARIERGKMELAMAAYEPRRLFDSVLRAWQPQARRKGFELKLEGLGHLPLKATGDEAKLRQILNNLLANAIKFTEHGAVIVRVKPAAGGAGEVLRVEVEDTGIGIAPENLSRIFEQFRQADSSISKRFGGTGLGLNIARRLVELMGGEMGVESEAGEGTVFWFTVRMTAGNEDAKAPAAFSAKRRSPGHRTAARVLLAEDNPVNQRIAEKLLTRSECCVTTVANGREALEALRRQEFDAIFMDCQMPEMNGLEAAVEIRKLGLEVPIIALTASAMPEEKEKCLAADMDDFLTKPIDLGELDRVLRTWVKGEDEAAQPGKKV